MKFDADLEKVWIYKLKKELQKIDNDILGTLHTFVKNPLISISDMHSLWGQWCPETREIKISLRLLRNYEWPAVVHVLRHEFAHLIVSEVFKMSMPGVSHGEAFKKACDVLKIDSNRCASHGYLSSYKTSEDEGVVGKVRKLMTKGHCESIQKEEADLFLNKAREIMIRHNIDMNSICGQDRFWVSRPVGKLMKHTPRYLSTLRDIVEKFYFVKTIRTWAYVNVGNRRRSMRVMEIFGEKHNVELAEYIYHALLSNAELLWNEFVAEQKAKHGYQDIRGIFHKNNFMDGLFDGYLDQLSLNDEKVVTPELEALIHVNDPLMEELFHKQYPSMKMGGRYYYGILTGGHGAGYAKGKTLRINHGVCSSSNSGGRLLTR